MLKSPNSKRNTLTRMKIKDKDLFFWIHVTSMTLTVVLTGIGTLFIFANESWHFVSKKHRFYEHSCCGIAVVVIASLQALVGFYRPEIGHKNRKYFNVGHWLLGRGLRWLAVATISLATHGLWKGGMFANTKGTIHFTILMLVTGLEIPL